jgi:hypothetical protein
VAATLFLHLRTGVQVRTTNIRHGG